MGNILIKDLYKKHAKLQGQEIQVSGWVRTIRSSKVFGFIELNDGSFFKSIQIVFEDIMKQKISDIEKKIGCEYKIVANLPYYITTPLVMEFIENSEKLTSMSVMVQEEVAYRFASKPNTADYGAITVGINLRGNATIIKKVGREMFTPMPNVDSAVVRIDFVKDKFNGVDFKAVREAVKIGFGARRKMLCNNLINSLKIERSLAETILTDADISLTARGEVLSVEEYIKLSESIEKYAKKD